ncbi:MAG: type IVB secretion system apparatus protein IcmL/DotI [Candidatus Eutrophobiaceae bacterium]
MSVLPSPQAVVESVQQVADSARSAGIQLVLERNHFYRDRYRLHVRISLALCLLCILLASALFWILSHAPPPVYFAVSSDGRVVPLVPLSKPHHSPDAIAQWAADLARKTYSFDFVHWKAQLSSLQGSFTEDAYTQFLKALKSSGNVQAVRERRLVGSAIAEPPTIVSEGILNDTYAWQVEVPLDVRFLSSEQSISQSVLVSMTIERIDMLNNPHGLAVNHFLTRLR